MSERLNSTAWRAGGCAPVLGRAGAPPLTALPWRRSRARTSLPCRKRTSVAVSLVIVPVCGTCVLSQLGALLARFRGSRKVPRPHRPPPQREGEVGAPQLAQSAVRAGFDAGDHNLLLGIESEHVLGAEGDADAAALAPRAVHPLDRFAVVFVILRGFTIVEVCFPLLQQTSLLPRGNALIAANEKTALSGGLS